MPNNNQCAIVVSSFDGFEDVWRPFFTLFFRYWPDCPFPIFLMTNGKEYPDHKINVIKIGHDNKWASNLKMALGDIRNPYILYLQEDYLLDKKVNTEDILRLLEHLKTKKAAYLRLVPSPTPTGAVEKGVGEIMPQEPYRTSLQAAFWDKKDLLTLLKDGESGWQMEFEGTERSRLFPKPFFSTNYWALPYFKQTGIKKGRWYYDAIQLCKKEGIDIDTSKRPVEPYNQYLWRKLSHLPVIGRPLRIIARKIRS